MWDELPAPGPSAPVPGSWLVLAEDDDRLANALTGALGSALLAAPLSYRDTGAASVRRHLGDAHRHVVMLCPAPVEAVGVETVERARDRVRRLTGLVRALADAGTEPRLYVVTRGARTPSGVGAPNLEQAQLRAVCRVASAEHPGLRVTHVDVDPDGGDPADLVAELLADSAEDEIAWRAGVRYAARLRRVPLVAGASRATATREHTGVFPDEGTVRAAVPPARVPVAREDGAYVITGGLGGLGLLLARRLADEGAGRVVLADRVHPDAEAGKTIAALRATGTDLDLVRADLSDPATAPRLVAAATATGLPLVGVAHAADAAEEAAIRLVDDDLLDRVWAPKAFGAWYLFGACAGQPLDWWLSCSSSAALIGGRGQAAYASADGWLDAFTAYGRTRGVPARGIGRGRPGDAQSSGES